MKSRDKQLRRLIRFIGEVKKGNFPNAISFAKMLERESEHQELSLKCSSKTIKRDVEYLKSYYNAPLEYDPTEKGYFLYMPDWNFPEVALSGDELFAELFTRKISENSLLPCLKEHLETGNEVQLTVSDDDSVSSDILGSVICATGSVTQIDENISEKIIEAWKECQTVETSYRKTQRSEAESRKLDIHALFLSEKIWYCRAWCYKREDFRNFSLHKFLKVENTDSYFKRSKKVVEELKKGSFFNYKKLAKVTAVCSPKVADYVSDREWFQNQKSTFTENGELEISFTDVPELAIKSWVSSFNGEVRIIEPLSLRKEIFLAAQKLMKEHS
ncbi:MAG: WYL domain-containing protein [Lentisphaeraceae bacterium]|nr:WYL domain-containing protein [Lentisphaeraceae bacterium]